eukprot:Ihof_evm2s585 gene=Ihof_evmTU2s585
MAPTSPPQSQQQQGQQQLTSKQVEQTQTLPLELKPQKIQLDKLQQQHKQQQHTLSFPKNVSHSQLLPQSSLQLHTQSESLDALKQSPPVQTKPVQVSSRSFAKRNKYQPHTTPENMQARPLLPPIQNTPLHMQIPMRNFPFPGGNLPSNLSTLTIQPSTSSPNSPSKRKHKEISGITSRIGDGDGSLKRSRFFRMAMEKGGKGLRHFSMKVCQKVKAKSVTSYNEVAEELVMEITAKQGPPGYSQRPSDDLSFDQKNIRRRVYDALNVLMAMNIITRDCKQIRWVGLPTNAAQEHLHLREEKRVRQERASKKREHLYELIMQQLTFKNLIARNRLEESTNRRPDSTQCVQLPYIMIRAPPETHIDCELADDGSEYYFNFGGSFEVHDEIEVLKRMDMAYGLERRACVPQDLVKARNLVPGPLIPYLEEMAGVRPIPAHLDDLELRSDMEINRLKRESTGETEIEKLEKDNVRKRVKVEAGLEEVEVGQTTQQWQGEDGHGTVATTTSTTTTTTHPEFVDEVLSEDE